MEKIDVIRPYIPDDVQTVSPDVAKMLKLKVDERTMFYFSTKEKRKRFIAKYYSRKTKKYKF